ncbi:MAG: hypothetical protein M1834_004853 [Cirrosporium novae-zelandiae]|nr:MAG: hypothetical protein M1834_004853 [Cirrosporium novae-zelandiae]
MASWTSEYLAALEVRDEIEKANLKTFNACKSSATVIENNEITDRICVSDTALADRAANLESATKSSAPDNDQGTKSINPSASGSLKAPKRQNTLPASEDSLAKIRHDLIEAQRTKAETQARLKATTEELERSKTKSKVDAKRIQNLTADRNNLSVRLRDVQEELRGKAKLLEDLQDETVTLNLQLNMAEEKSKKLQQENKELIDRWMVRIGQEADAMNKQMQ